MRRALIGWSILVLGTAGAASAAPQKAVPRRAMPAKTQAAPALPAGAIMLPAMSYTIVRSGPADGPHPARSDLVTVNYTLTLRDGTVLDSTEGRGPATFPLNQLIPGWQVLLQLMRPGDVWMLYVPAEYGYGASARPGLPANSFLTFKVELLSIGGEAPIRQEQ